ncbi:restriction endonuclease subunit S [Bradyrhizobium diazoefficiens]|uniref:restriction endonuclease subunit S n=1 Tax=Bradyrhizobium diazoefficiens TaxID=1355477 RepID=UPI00347F4882
MAKETQSKVLPRLRFPEFREADAWELRQGNDLFDAINNREPSENLPILAITQEHGAIPRDQIDYHVSVTEKSIESYKVVEQGDFIISLRSFQGGIEYSKYQGICSPAYVILRRKGEGLDDYFRHLFKSTRFIQQLTRNIEGLRDGKMISYKQFSEQLIQVPEPPEQQKIADCLTSLDELIAAQDRKVEALKTYKRGLMQQLFPREGETLPRLRFPAFHEEPQWTSMALEPFIEEFREKSQVQDEYEVLTSARSGLVRQRDYYDNDRITERDNIGFNIIPPGYMTYRSRSDDRRFYFNENDLGITGIISTYYPVFRIRGGSNKFFVELLSRNAELVGKRSVGTSQTVLSLNELRRIKLPVPSISEQQQIAGVLASLDDGIIVASDKLEALKLHKKGLVQQLLPPEEV